ncbi:MAG: hypothetical protein ACRDIV_14820 [Ktedonobacteraceae bacterium]
MPNRQRYARANKMNARQQVGLLLLLLSSVFPGLVITGFIPDFGVLTYGLSTWIIISIVGGAIAGSLFMNKMAYWYVGSITGVLISPGMLIATYYYTVFRTHLFSIEIIIPMVLGALPGLCFLFVVNALYFKRKRAQNMLPAGQSAPVYNNAVQNSYQQPGNNFSAPYPPQPYPQYQQPVPQNPYPSQPQPGAYQQGQYQQPPMPPVNDPRYPQRG